MRERERKIFEYVRQAAINHRRATVDEVAKYTNIPRSSVAYSAKALGYNSWSDMTEKIFHYFESHPGGTGALAEYVEAVADMLRRCKNKHILVDAVGDAEISVEYVLTRFSEIGYPAQPYSYAAAKHAQYNNSAGLLLVLNESGMTLLSSCLEALDAGFEVVAITASHDTPISKIAGVNVVIKNNKSDVWDYKPNYFTPAALVFIQKVMAVLERKERQTSDSDELSALLDHLIEGM